MTVDELMQDGLRRMDQAVEHARNEFNTVRTGRASAALLDRITINYYGQDTPLKQLATINVPEPRMLTIQPFDPTSIKAIERGLKVMDTTALSLCMDNDLPIYVFGSGEGNLRRVVDGERVGTIISTGKVAV